MAWLSLAAALLLSAPAQAANLDLIKRLGPDAYRNETLRAPFIAVYAKGKKELIFIAGDHGVGVDSPVAKTIKDAFKRFKPKAVVVEGLSDSGEAWLKQAKVYAETNPKGFPENYYPAYLADKAHIPFIGGEPTRKQTYDAAKDLGYTAADVMGLAAAANVGAMTHKDPRVLAQSLDDYLTREAKTLGLTSYRYADYERWYDTHGGIGKKANELDGMDTRPYNEKDANFIQKIAYDLELVREHTIVVKIARMLKEHDRVLVVYGSGHLVRQREVWKDELGAPKDEKPY